MTYDPNAPRSINVDAKLAKERAHEAAKAERSAERKLAKVKGEIKKRSRPYRISEKEVAEMRARSKEFRENPQKLQDYIQEVTITMLQTDDKLGTEPWRLSGREGLLMGNAARERFIKQAGQLLADIRAASGGEQKKLTAGEVLDAEPVR